MGRTRRKHRECDGQRESKKERLNEKVRSNELWTFFYAPLYGTFGEGKYSVSGIEQDGLGWAHGW